MAFRAGPLVIAAATFAAACGSGSPPASDAGAAPATKTTKASSPAEPAAAALDATALAAAFSVPRLVTAGVMGSRSMAVEAVYFATAQTGALQVGGITKTGTISVTPSGTSYSPSPADRLIVKAGDQTHEFEGIEATGGGQSPTATGWLDAPHQLRYTHRIAGQVEASIDEQFDGRTFATHAAGWMTIQGQKYDVDLWARGGTSGQREYDGRESLTQYDVTGSIKGAGVDVDVHERHLSNFASTNSVGLMASQRGYADQFRATMTSTFRAAGSTFRFDNVSVESGARQKGTQESRGMVAATGAILRDDRPFGRIQLQSGRPVALLATGSTIPLDLPQG